MVKHGGVASPEAQDRRRSVKVTLPGGVVLEIRGYDIVLVVLVFAAGFLGSILLEHRAEASSSTKDLYSTMRRQEVLLEELRWILMQPMDVRQTLKLDMPQSLRKDAAASNNNK